MLTLAIGTGVMLAAIPSHTRLPLAAAAMLNPPHPENCSPADRWLDHADDDVTASRFHTALHHLALSQRDCPSSAERDRLYALAYDGTGDRLSAIAAASRWVDSSNGGREACALFTTLLPHNRGGAARDWRCADDTLSAQP